MRVRLLTSVKDGSEWFAPGVVRDFSDADANRLIRLKAAESASIPAPSEEGNEDEIADDELQEYAADLMEIDGINDDLAYRLIEAGYKTVQSVAEADPSDLIEVKGIGKRSVGRIQESAEDLLDSVENEDEEEEEED